MLILSKSQAKNYMKKLQPSYHSEGCGCCHESIKYSIDNNRILKHHNGEQSGHSFYRVDVIAKIKKQTDVRSN